MKKYVALILVLLIASGLFIYSFMYKDNAQRNIENSITATITTRTNPKNIVFTDDDIIAKTDNNEYKLYYKDEIARVEHNGIFADFDNWSDSIVTEAPVLYYNDFDSDGEKELIVKLFEETSDITGNNESSYILYLFKPDTNVNDKEYLSYYTAQSNLWKGIFSKSINVEISQLKKCKKYVQFVMGDAGSAIRYDTDSGITTSKYVSFFKCDSDTKKNYYTVSNYKKGLGIYSITDDGKIYLDIQVIINYEENNFNYHVGYIRCELTAKDGKFSFIPSTIHMVPLDEYTIDDPRDVPADSWHYTVNLTGSSQKNDKSISWLEGNFDISKGSQKTLDALTFSSDISKLSAIDFTEDTITFKAKKVFTFYMGIVENGRFAVYLDKEHKNDVSYTAEINGNKLIIKLQKAYQQDELTDYTVVVDK